MDKLAQDSTDAIKAGMSYGQWMAMRKPVVVKKPTIGREERKCPCCGVVFTPHHGSQKYCGSTCQIKAKGRRKNTKTLDDIDAPLIKNCPVCGKQFIAESYRNKYCGDFCRQLAKNKKCSKISAEEKGG